MPERGHLKNPVASADTRQGHTLESRAIRSISLPPRREPCGVPPIQQGVYEIRQGKQEKAESQPASCVMFPMPRTRKMYASRPRFSEIHCNHDRMDQPRGGQARPGRRGHRRPGNTKVHKMTHVFPIPASCRRSFFETAHTATRGPGLTVHWPPVASDTSLVPSKTWSQLRQFDMMGIRSQSSRGPNVMASR